MAIAALIDGLERSTNDLLAALERQSPAYLEHLERREAILLRLVAVQPSELDEQAGARLERVRATNGTLEAQARRMRALAAAAVRQAELDRQLARSLAATAARRHSTLDVKA